MTLAKLMKITKKKVTKPNKELEKDPENLSRKKEREEKSLPIHARLNCFFGLSVVVLLCVDANH